MEPDTRLQPLAGIQPKSLVKAFLRQQWFLICLASMLVVGFFFSRSLAILTEWAALRNAILFSVLFVMALPVATEEIGRALRSPWAALYASLINIAFLPMTAWAFSFSMDQFLGDGLVIAAAVPCTLASAAVWTRRAGGNDSVAIFVTLITNALCFLITPFWLWLTMKGENTNTTIDVQALILKLGLLVVLPMVLAQIARQFRTVGSWSTRNKVPLSTLAQIGILTMVTIGAAKMGNKFAEGEASFSFGEVAVVLFAVNAIHLSALFFGFWTAKALGFGRKEQIAIGIAGSQKTLMVGLNTAVEINRSILPMLLFHICQLVFDTIIADRWKKKDLGNTD